MTRTENTLNMTYTYDPSHKGAPYTMDGGQSWKNHGDLCEIALKSVLGFKAEKDGNGSYDTCSDIEELNTSVKSAKATLVNKVLGDCFDSYLDKYLATVHSNRWAWVTIIDDVVVAYWMDKAEFVEFTKMWAYWTADRKVIRYKDCSSKMLRWLDGKVTA